MICARLEKTGPSPADALVGDGLSIAAVLTALTKLELLGAVIRHPNGSYSLSTH